MYQDFAWKNETALLLVRHWNANETFYFINHYTVSVERCTTAYWLEYTVVAVALDSQVIQDIYNTEYGMRRTLWSQVPQSTRSEEGVKQSRGSRLGDITLTMLSW